MTATFDRMTTSDIAKLADVEVSTVSNWRKRHDDFPKPIDDSAGRPVFPGPAVRTWLRGQNPKYAAIIDTAENHDRADSIIRSWRHVINSFFVGSGTAELDELIGLFIARVQGMPFRYTEDFPGRGQHGLDVDGLAISITVTDQQRDDIETFFSEPFDVPSQDLIAAAASDLDQAGRWRRTSESITAGENLNAFLAGLIHRDAATVLDFACGTGGLLAAVAEHLPDARLTGVEPDVLHAFVAESRLESRSAEVIEGNILAHDSLGDRKFDAVISIPPYGLQVGDDLRDLARRLQYGQVRGVADAAWPQLAVDALAPHGDAVLVLPSSLAYESRADQVRRELVRAGVVWAVVALPANAHPAAKIATDLWVLRGAGSGAHSGQVLFLDATGKDGANAAHYDQVASVLNEWLDDGPFDPDKDVKSATVDLLDLLDSRVNLSPQHWVARAERDVDPDDLRRAVDTAFDQALSAMTRLNDLPTPRPRLHKAALPMLSVSDMRAEGIVEIVRPAMSSQGRSGDESSKALRVTVPVAEAIRGRRFTMPDVGADDSLAGTSPTAKTQAGDVLVWTTHGRQVRATVCPYDGLIPTSFVQVVRCLGVNPHYVALCLEAGRHVAHIVGTTAGRLQLMDIELPVASPSQGGPAETLTKQLGDLEEAAHRLLEATAQARATLDDAIASGQLEFDNTEKR